MGIRALCVAMGALLFACGDNIEPPEEPDPVVLVTLDTLTPTQVAAGDTITVTCTLLENDITTMIPNADLRVMSEDSVMRVGALVVARRVSTVEIACALPARGLIDPTPALVEIVAGPPANVVTTITPDPVVAGNNVVATCDVYDAYGNRIYDQMPTLQLTPIDAANSVVDLTALMIRAGHYTGRCLLPGTTSNNAGFDVIPNLPFAILLSRSPDLPVYAINSPIEILHVVTDRYGNDIFNAAVTRASVPITGVGPTSELSPGVFRYGGEGRYRVDVTVVPPTDMDVPVTASIEILINSRGPAIVCANDALMLNHTPGVALTVSGSATDVNGVASLTVNGTPVVLGSNGSFSASVPTRFGMNFVDVSATDDFGEATTKVCTFLVSNRYGSTVNPLGDTVSLKLTQPAVDDFDRSGVLDSLADLLHTIVNSQGLKTAVHNALLAANPLKPNTCDSQSCTFFGCVCWYRSEVIYINSAFNGPNTVSLTLVDGGLRAVARMENIGVQLRVRGNALGIPFDTTGWVRVSYVEVRLTLDTYIQNARPHISVRPGSVSSDVGTITTEFNGVDGWIINNIVVPLAQGYIRDALRNLITSFVTNNFNSVLDSLISNLDISTLGATFNVPKLGGGTLPMNFGLGFSYLNSSPARLLFGIGTRFTTTPANAFPSLGVPLPPGVNLIDMSLTAPSNTGVGAHVGIFNGALHALWRGNYFNATIGGALLGLPSTVSIAAVTRLPPVTLISASNVVQLHLGAVDLTVQHPDLPPNLTVRLGADAHASVTLVGNDLVFGGIVIDDLHLSTDAVNLTPSQQTSLETTLTTLAQQMVNTSLNSSLPALPIPGFTIPASLGIYGLPTGKQIGINAPSLVVQPQHFVLRGQFGIRP